MAGRLLVSCDPALDENGDPMPGAKLYTYAPNTTTPKATYTTSALTDEHPNPVVADAAGRFPDLWAADGETYRLSWKTKDSAPSDPAIRVYEDVQAQGEDLSIFERDYGPNGRLQVYGDAGEVNFEAGPPVGDDTGGDLRIGGWAGSKGDRLDLDFDTIQFGDYQLADVVIETGAVTASATKDFQLPTGFDFFSLTITELAVTDGAELRLRARVGNDAEFRSGGDDYRRVVTLNGSVNVSDGDCIRLSGPISNTAGDFYGRYEISTKGTRVRGGASYLNPSLVETDSRATGKCVGNTGFAKYLRLYASAGNVTFKYRLTGQKTASA